MIRFAGTACPCLHAAAGFWLLLTFQTVVVRPSPAQDVLTTPPILNGGNEAQTATAGYYALSWAHPARPESGLHFQVQESALPTFRAPDTIYEGPDFATFVSGRQDGALYYRVRARPIVSQGSEASNPSHRWSPWSDVLTVTTNHHSLARAFAFLGIGAVVFLATVALIVVGNRADATRGSNPAEADD